MDKLRPVQGNDLASFAGGDVSVWLNLVNSRVVHSMYGDGYIVGFEERKNRSTLVSIKFTNDTEIFRFELTSWGLPQITIYVDSILADSVTESAKKREVEYAAYVREREAITAREAAEKTEKAKIKQALLKVAEKYNVSARELQADDALLMVTAIIEKLENNERVNEDELGWLESRNMYRLVATIYYSYYKHNRDPWELVKTCKYLRKAKLPEKAVSVSASLDLRDISDPHVRSALLTTRGGAFRDMGDIKSAKSSAMQAIYVSPSSYHPYNLLGAVLYEEGAPCEGDQYFEKALELGATHHGQDSEIKTALERSSGEVRKRIVEYLLSKNPKKYAWVSKVII